MHDTGFLPISDIPEFSNKFLPIADGDTDVCTYFFPPNCKEHQVPPALEKKTNMHTPITITH